MKEQKQYEQFFFSKHTGNRLFHLASQFKRPVFLCTPTLAKMAEVMKAPYLLLDHDRRFKAMKNYQYFDLFAPHYIETPFDAIFSDPPFSNITIPQFYRAVETLNGFQGTENLFICHISTSQTKLISTFSNYNLVRYSEALSYETVKRETQEKIFLFGPERFLKYDLNKQ